MRSRKAIEEEIKAEFQMFVPEDDGSAMDWLENKLTQVHQAGIDEGEERALRSKYVQNKLKEAKEEGLQEAYKNLLNNIISDDVEELTAEGLRREIILRVKYDDLDW